MEYEEGSDEEDEEEEEDTHEEMGEFLVPDDVLSNQEG